MKKNIMLRLACVLLICVVLTVSVVGGTFAKYVTQARVDDAARVAKWGVTFTATSDLFQASYTTGGTDATSITVNTTDVNTKLVAPGTSGTGFGISSDGGNPEVSYEMKLKLGADPKVPTLKYKTSSTATSFTPYQPIVFTILNGDTKLATKNISELTELFSAEATIYTFDVSSGKYTVDADLDGIFAETPTATRPNIKIKWEWPIDTGTGEEAVFHSKLDTILGDLAAGITGDSEYKFPSGISGIDPLSSTTAISLNWTMTATQID